MASKKQCPNCKLVFPRQVERDLHNSQCLLNPNRTACPVNLCAWVGIKLHKHLQKFHKMTEDRTIEIRNTNPKKTAKAGSETVISSSSSGQQCVEKLQSAPAFGKGTAKVGSDSEPHVDKLRSAAAEMAIMESAVRSSSGEPQVQKLQSAPSSGKETAKAGFLDPQYSKDLTCSKCGKESLTTTEMNQHRVQCFHTILCPVPSCTWRTNTNMETLQAHLKGYHVNDVAQPVPESPAAGMEETSMSKDSIYKRAPEDTVARVAGKEQVDGATCISGEQLSSANVISSSAMKVMLTCEKCGEVAHGSKEHNLHRNKCHGNKETPFVCLVPDCNWKNLQKQSMIDHLSVRHKKTWKQYLNEVKSCSIASKRPNPLFDQGGPEAKKVKEKHQSPMQGGSVEKKCKSPLRKHSVMKTGQTLPIAKSIIIYEVPTSVSKLDLTRFFPSAKISLLHADESSDDHDDENLKKSIALVEFSSRAEMLWYRSKNQGIVKCGDTQLALQDMQNSSDYQDIFGSHICSCGTVLSPASTAGLAECSWCVEHCPAKCPVHRCVFLCDSTAELSEHLGVEHCIKDGNGTLFLCPVQNCKTLFDLDGLMSELSGHLDTVHTVPPGKKGTLISCPIKGCILRFGDGGRSRITEHLKQEHSTLDLHLGLIFLCPVNGCLKISNTSNKMFGHLVAEHRGCSRLPDATNAVLLECPVDCCPYMFEDDKDIFNHLQREHSLKDTRSPISPVILVLGPVEGQAKPLLKTMVLSAVKDLVSTRCRLAENFQSLSIQDRTKALKEIQLKERRLSLDEHLKRQFQETRLGVMGCSPGFWQLELANQLSAANHDMTIASLPIDKLLNHFSQTTSSQSHSQDQEGTKGSILKKQPHHPLDPGMKEKLQDIVTALAVIDHGASDLSKFEMLVELSKIVLSRRAASRDGALHSTKSDMARQSTPSGDGFGNLARQSTVLGDGLGDMARQSTVLGDGLGDMARQSTVLGDGLGDMARQSTASQGVGLCVGMDMTPDYHDYDYRDGHHSSGIERNSSRLAQVDFPNVNPYMQAVSDNGNMMDPTNYNLDNQTDGAGMQAPGTFFPHNQHYIGGNYSYR